MFGMWMQLNTRGRCDWCGRSCIHYRSRGPLCTAYFFCSQRPGAAAALLLNHYALKLGGENVSAIRGIYAWITTKSKDFSFWSNLASLNALIFPILEHSVLLCISGRKPLLTFSSSKRWNRRTWIAWTIWKWKKWKQLANVWRLLRFFLYIHFGICYVCVVYILYFVCNKYFKKSLNHIVQVFFLDY